MEKIIILAMVAGSVYLLISRSLRTVLGYRKGCVCGECACQICKNTEGQ